MRNSQGRRWPVVRALCSRLIWVLLLTGCEGKAVPSPAPTTPIVDSVAPGVTEAGPLSVLGTVLPAQRLELGFSVSGAVKAVNVQIGTEVKAGDLLAELDTTDLMLDVREAKEALALCQASLDQAKAGPREQEVAVAEAEVQRALAQHEELLANSPPEEIAAAQADYQAARARYEQVKAGASGEELIAAEADVKKAEIALKRAQAAYDLVAWRPDVEASPQAAALHEATVDYEAAKARYEKLKNLPTQADLQEAKAQVVRTEAQLRMAQAGPTEQEVAVGTAAVHIAQARWALAKAGPRSEDVAAVEAQVQQARTALERAVLALSRAQLTAPFDGTISAVHLSPEEWAGPGVPVVELLDTSHWLVETRNMGELNIGRVQVAQEASVRVIAFRDTSLRGRVVAISPIAVVQQGDTTYTVFIELEPTDLNLRPGMNVEVEIAAE